MNRELQFQLYQDFIVNCTTVSKSVKNYSDFKRINECLSLLFPAKKDVSILDFDNPIEFEDVISKLLIQKQFVDYEQKGGNQYSNTLKHYLRFLYAKMMFSKTSNLASNNIDNNLPLQTIFYGAPGTGKSYKVKSEKLVGVPEENIFRTTFHPDYDYASFVGCYKPTKEDDKITYSFIPQVFTKAYIKAWEEMKQENPQPVYLVIEEINRGNCAQIFGDIFQLLDRNDAGFSTYPIVLDADITRELKTVFASLDLSSVENYINGIFSENYPGGIVDKIKSGELLVLPCNLNLLATMNTSDQSLFPMDSAFKRRWDWEFVPIRYSATEAKDDKDNFHTFEIEIGDKKYKWTDFLEKVNAKILSVTDSEDKQMGEYFIKKSVDEKTFINKVMYYLWSEVGKDLYGSTNPFFVQKTKNENGQDVENQFSFNDLFKGNATDLLLGFMKKLEVKSEEEKAGSGNNDKKEAPEE